MVSEAGAWKSPAGAMLSPWERAPSSSGLCTPLEVETVQAHWKRYL